MYVKHEQDIIFTYINYSIKTGYSFHYTPE